MDAFRKRTYLPPNTLQSKWLAVILIVKLVFLAGSVIAAQLPPADGEKLVFLLRWGPIHAGSATMEFHGRTEIKGQQALHFVTTARTNDFFDIFYKVRERIEGFTNPEFSRSVYYRKKSREGRHRRDFQVLFDLEKNVATYCHAGRACEPPVVIRADTFDPLSCFLYFRRIPLEGVDTVKIHVTDGKAAAEVPVYIIGRERITTPAGEFDTIKVEPVMSILRGVFEREKNAKIYLWVTNDQRRLPVMLKSKITLGYFTAELKEISRLDKTTGHAAQRIQ